MIHFTLCMRVHVHAPPCKVIRVKYVTKHGVFFTTLLAKTSGLGQKQLFLSFVYYSMNVRSVHFNTPGSIL